MKTELVQIYPGYIKADKPLPLPLYSEDGNLMANKGVSLSHEKVVSILTNPRILTPRSELIEAMEHIRLDRYKTDEHNNNDYAFKLTATTDALHKLEKEFLQLIISNEPGFEKSMLHLSKRLCQLVERSQDACLASIFLRTTNSAIISVSFSTAIIGTILTQHMHWDQKERMLFIAASLTLEISNLASRDGELVNLQPEFSAINSMAHIQPAIDILKKRGVTSKKWFSYILTHHAYDPKSESPEKASIELDMAMSLMNLVHHYAAMVTGYGYEQIILPDVAINYIFQSEELRYQKYFARLFESHIGKYPAGTIVNLGRGVTGIVIRQSSSINSPLIRVIREQNNKPPRTITNITADTNANPIISTMFDINLIRRINFSNLWH